MDGTLKLTSNTLAYADVGSNSNPAMKFVDWSVKREYAVANPKTEPFTLDPGATLTLFDSLRTTAIDNTTEFLLSASILSANRYRFTWTGTGTSPALRTPRAVNASTHVISMTANANLTVTMESDTTGDFAAVVVGDTLLIPDPSTGDAASPFSPLNAGLWTVLSKDGTSTILQIARLPGASFSGTTEDVTVASAGQTLFYSAAGVQVGDKVTISTGFATAVLSTYVVQAVTATWFEVIATQPMPTDVTGVPGATGMLFYSGAKRYIRLTADQETTVRLNGDTGNSNRLSPWTPGDPAHTAFMEKVGPCWKAVVINLSSSPLNLLFISAE